MLVLGLCNLSGPTYLSSSMNLQYSTQTNSVYWLPLHVASIESLGGCDVCNKLRALCVTHPTIEFRGSHNKLVLGLQTLPLHTDTWCCRTKIEMACKTMPNDNFHTLHGN